MKSMSTFIELYVFLQTYNGTVIDLLKIQKKGVKIVNKELQESLLRLFACLGLIYKLKKYTFLKGNYTRNKLKGDLRYIDIFYDDKNNLIGLADKGDKSDLTGYIKDKKILLATTSKNYGDKYKESVLGLDLAAIENTYNKKYKQLYSDLHIAVCIKNKKRLDETIKNAESYEEKEILRMSQKLNLIIDWNDLEAAFNTFKIVFKNTRIEDFRNKIRKPFLSRLHQRVTSRKTMTLKNNGIEKVLWGHVARSGKSYIMADTILLDINDKSKCNYLYLTPIPNETKKQVIKIFNSSIGFEGFKVVNLKGKEKLNNLGDKNIIIASIQFFRGKTKNSIKDIHKLKNINFDIIFLDEAHHYKGDINKNRIISKVFEKYRKHSFTVYMTATYNIPTNIYKIPRLHWILWDMEDISLAKRIDKDEFKQKLIEKHGEVFKSTLKEYSIDDIINTYKKTPQLVFITQSLRNVDKLIKETEGTGYGWSLEGLFTINEGDKKFQNPNKVLQNFKGIFGDKNKRGISTTEFKDNTLQQIIDITSGNKIKVSDKFVNPYLPTSRNIQNSKDPIVFLAFLPVMGVDNISKNIKKLLQDNLWMFNKNNKDDGFDILITNSKQKEKDAKTAVENAIIKAKENNKKGILVLAGGQLQMGVSIPLCDVVLLLNTTNSFDSMFQSMFRALTEDDGKNLGFVVDYNIHRVINNNIYRYSMMLRPDETDPKEAIKYLIRSKIINLNPHEFNTNVEEDLIKITDNLYKVYTSNIDNLIDEISVTLSGIQVNIDRETQNKLNVFNVIEGKKPKKPVDKNIKKGVKKITEDSDKEKEGKKDVTKEEKKTDVDVTKILESIIPVICFLNIYNKDKVKNLKDMYNYIERDYYLTKILLNQVENSFKGNKHIDKNIIDLIIKDIYINKMSEKQLETHIKILKENFTELTSEIVECGKLENLDKLSEIIDKYLVPTKIEKKDLAEIPTPKKLREEMLNKIPEDFWEDISIDFYTGRIVKPRIFEPSVGKGGFLIDMIRRLCNSKTLEKHFPDNRERYTRIVNDCIYFSDISELNIFVCKTILNPNNSKDIKLNYNIGNTLELDTKEKWGIDGFDAVIGNPPYESQTGTGDNKLYLEFTKYSINKLYKNGILLFITPTTIIDYIIQMDKNRNYIDEFYNIEYIALNTPDKYFTVSSTFTYFMLKKQKYTGNTIIEHYKGKDTIILKKGMKLPKILSKIDLSIIDKICSTDNCYDIKKCKFLNKTQRIRKQHITKNIVSTNKSESHKYKIYDTINKTNPNGKYYYYDKLDYDAGKKRIIFSNKGYLLPFVCENKDVTYSDNFSYILYETNLLKLMKSKIVDYLVYQYSKNGFDRINCIKMIKKVVLKDNIYESFNLTSEEIKIIEESI